MFDLNHAVANLADFGLTTEPWVPQRQDGDNRSDTRPIGGGVARPIVKISNLEVFRTTWPNADQVILAGVNGGQSTRVKLQAVIRPAVEKNPKVSDTDLTVKQLQALLGVKAPATPAELSDEALYAEIARRRGITVEEARELLA